MSDLEFLNKLIEDIKAKYGEYREAIIKTGFALKGHEDPHLYVDRFFGGNAPTIKQLTKLIQKTTTDCNFPPDRVLISPSDRGHYYVYLKKNE